MQASSAVDSPSDVEAAVALASSASWSGHRAIQFSMS
jgi:hypothetical protein